MKTTMNKRGKSKSKNYIIKIEKKYDKSLKTYSGYKEKQAHFDKGKQRYSYQIFELI